MVGYFAGRSAPPDKSRWCSQSYRYLICQKLLNFAGELSFFTRKTYRYLDKRIDSPFPDQLFNYNGESAYAAYPEGYVVLKSEWRG